MVTFSKSHVYTFGKKKKIQLTTELHEISKIPFSDFGSTNFSCYKLSEVALRFIIHQTLVTQPHMISHPKNSVNYGLAICLQPPGNSDAWLNLPRLESEQK